MTILQRIFYEMNEKGLKQKDLAAIIGVPTSTISTWKSTNKNPPAEKIIEIADYLGVSVYYLLTGNEKLNIGCNSTFHNNGTVAISENQKVNFPEDTPAQVNDEMTAELVKRFSNLSFDEKLNVFDYIKNIK